jgi:NADPH:quinone reductase-like Zn-dependent oxidoreductase
VGINYRTNPNWEALVLERTGGEGADITVETGGAGTLEASMKATRAGGVIAYLGALTGLKAEVNTGLVLMKRLHLAGIYVDSRACFQDLLSHLAKQSVRPVIDRVFDFDELPEALRVMERGDHFGKIVLEL